MKLIVGPALVKRIASRVLSLIHFNTESGRDADGKPFAPYSTTPFAMPAGAFFSKTTARQRAKLNANGDLSFFRAKSGKRWVVIDGGYLNFKRSKSPRFRNVVDLTDTGQMMRSLAIIRSDDSSAVLGFTNEEAGQKAYFHNVAGTGRKKKIRKFLGITKSQEAEVAQLLKGGVTIDFSDLIKK